MAASSWRPLVRKMQLARFCVLFRAVLAPQASMHQPADMPHASKRRRWLVTSDSDPQHLDCLTLENPPCRSRQHHAGPIPGISSREEEWAQSGSESPSWHSVLDREGSSGVSVGGASASRPAQASDVLSSDEEARYQQTKKRFVDLALSDLTLHANIQGAEPRKQATSYERNGASPSRIREALLQCHACCKKKCGPRLADTCETKLIDVLTFWHLHLSATERCFLIQQMYESSFPCSGVHQSFGVHTNDIDKTLRRVNWRLCGQDVCKHAFVTISGIGTRTLYNMTKGIDGSLLRESAGPRSRPQCDIVSQFFLELYMSAAEPLPHEFKVVGGTVDECNDDEYLDAIDEEWNPERSVPAVISALLGTETGLPRRFISHNTLTNLYWMFTSTFCSGVPEAEDEVSDDDGVAVQASQKIPSFTTFHYVWKTQWSKYLRLRKESQHAECRTCFEARQRLHTAGTSLASKIDIARQWKEHLRAQYLDRSIYWHCRFASRHKLGVLTVIIDSMDKAKFAWPQFPWHRVDKTLEGTHRPRLVLTAAMAHGFATCFYIADEDVSHGASAFCDILARVIEKVAVVSRRSGVTMPAHLVVQTDNTVAQAKNNEANLFLAYLVSRHKFHTANMFHLIVGHTHEDIDQLFGMILMLVLRRKKFQTKQELAANIVEVMHPRVAMKKEELVVEVLDHVRDFGSWLGPLRVHLYNAFMNRAGIEAPHAFVYKMRRDLFSVEQAMLTGRQRIGDDHDVFCCVKTYMHDDHLQQAPVLVLPADRVRSSGVSGSPRTAIPRAPLSDARKADLRDLATALRQTVYNLQRGADALDELAAGPPAIVFPSSQWLESAVFDPRAVLAPSRNELFPHLPDSSWHLMVRFKRT